MITKLFTDIIKGRFLGHPVHTMIIHFPVALFFFSAIADALTLFYEKNPFAFAAFVSGMTGTVLGWGAAIFGIIDLLSIDPESKAFKVALTHGGLNLLWLSAFSVITGVQLKMYPDIANPPVMYIIIKLFIILGMLVSNFLGGQLIYKYKVVDKET